MEKDHASFMEKKLSEAIRNRSKFKNKYLKRPSCENLSIFKRQKNIYAIF